MKRNIMIFLEIKQEGLEEEKHEEEETVTQDMTDGKVRVADIEKPSANSFLTSSSLTIKPTRMLYSDSETNPLIEKENNDSSEYLKLISNDRPVEESLIVSPDSEMETKSFMRDINAIKAGSFAKEDLADVEKPKRVSDEPNSSSTITASDDPLRKLKLILILIISNLVSSKRREKLNLYKM